MYKKPRAKLKNNSDSECPVANTFFFDVVTRESVTFLYLLKEQIHPMEKKNTEDNPN